MVITKKVSSREETKKPVKYSMLPVAMRFGDTPVPIPNTMVKTKTADDTWLETTWESRWLPDIFYSTNRR